MPRRRRNARGSINIQLPQADIGQESIALAPRNWESDGPDDNLEYNIAVSCVLEALEGLWFDSDDYEVEQAVNNHVQSLKRKIQEML